MGFCNFHLGEYEKSLAQYQQIKMSANNNNDHQIYYDDRHMEININIAICMFYLGMYQESQTIIENLSNGPLKIRLLFHLSHKLNDNDRMMELHSSLRDVTEDQLSLAGMHYLRANYQEAIDIYKRVLLDNK